MGGGPAGSATAYWAARHGLDVVVVERKQFPRDKTCGDGLTPRAVKALDDMGLGDELTRYHRYGGLRAVAHNRTMELAWPRHPEFPDYGYVVRRRELDQLVADHAAAAGAEILLGTEATRPILVNGLLNGAEVVDKADGRSRPIRARYVAVADGANSRFGRALGTARDRSYPQGMAIRTYFESPLHDTPWIESALDVRDRNGNSLPGYGWIFPLGDGTVNVGVGLLSTFRDYTSVNTSYLMQEFAATLPDYWEIDPDRPLMDPVGGRLPMAGSVHPKVGPNHLVVGDAAGSVNPFNGEGIDYAYETGKMAADLIAEAIATGRGEVIWRYTSLLDEHYGDYFRVARLFARLIGNPALLRELTRIGMQSRPAMDWALRIMANLMDPDHPGAAEYIYKAAAKAAALAPA
ncbi:geranylgeranyl reductase family protein [Candidatus Poriferisocius sp.]|uniref:geranylgeranyl reductase family protein n=1 Tax=Candidatus Poriferisocius sp. TaxID=3101276 RepID=UPI003B58BD33